MRFMTTLKQFQTGSAVAEYLLALVLVLTTTLIGFAFVSDNVTKEINSLTQAFRPYPPDDELESAETIVLNDEFFYKYGAPGAGPAEPDSFIRLNPDGTIRISISPGNLILGGAILFGLMLSLLIYRFGVRR